VFEYRGLQDALFVALYCVAAFAALVAAVYLLLRRRNIFMRETGDEDIHTVESPTGEPMRLGLRVRSSLRLRRWTATFMVAIAASHVWWYAVGQWWLRDDWLVRTILVILMDYVVLVPLVMGVLLAMLQDRRRPLWPWLVAQVPLVGFAVVGIARRDKFFGYELGHYWQLAICAVFIGYYIVALRQYGRWLLCNYASLEYKEVWQSLVFALCLFAVYGLYIFATLSLLSSGARPTYKRDSNTYSFTRGSPASIYDFSCIHAREAASFFKQI